MMLLKRLPAAVLFGILLFCSARAETARVDVVGIVTDGNALVFTVQVSAVSDEQDLYGSLDTVYVNGREAETVKSTAPTYGFLTDPQIYTVTLDISAIPPALDYNVAATYTVLRPNQPIRLIDDIITDDFDTYRETVSNLNDQGYVVATRSGDILLAQGTYETDWLISGRLEESGKMTVIDTIPILFTATVGDIAVIEAHG
ncbi:MAG: hypothetical protein FWF86_08055, partial [Clostridia bacterium]|nr:hypothetical protein [Clostridia bacterium]